MREPRDKGSAVQRLELLKAAAIDKPCNDLTHVEGLAIDDGRVYVSFGGLDGDCGPYIGSVVGVPDSGTGALVSYQVPATRKAGIWAAGGPVLGSNGNLVPANRGPVDASYVPRRYLSQRPNVIYDPDLPDSAYAPLSDMSGGTRTWATCLVAGTLARAPFGSRRECLFPWRRSSDTARVVQRAQGGLLPHQSQPRLAPDGTRSDADLSRSVARGVVDVRPG